MTPYLLAAFAGGMGALLLRQPPLVGFLLGGFALNVLGYELDDTLVTIGDLGVTLLLFTIGLKLRVRSLLRPEVWGGATIHMAGSTVIFAVLVAVLRFAGLGLIAGLDWRGLVLLGFALSFSSTVFAVKVLESRSELGSLYGRVAIGVLIVQDIFAVVFLGASEGAAPSLWALLLLLLLPAARLLRWALERVGHGEMQVLFGVLLALTLGYALFEALGIKGDLGALIIGMLLAPSPAAAALSRSLFNVKELLLVGFFLSIGLTALPTVETLVIAVALVAVLPLKSALYLVVFSRFGLGTRTSLLSTLSLSNYSEFGLIVASLATSAGWLDPEWLVVIAVALSISFVFAAPLNEAGEAVYRRVSPRIQRLQTATTHPGERPLEVEGVDAVVLGMGRIGTGVYDRLVAESSWEVLGIETDPQRVEQRQADGYHVVEGDAANSDFWERLLLQERCQLVVLAMPHHDGNLHALEQLRRREFAGKIAAVVQYEDQVERLRKLGADAVFNLYGEAGRALADDALAEFELDAR